MRKAIVVSVLVLASILLGSLAAGTPVAGNDTVAAVTAGINLGTAPVVRAASTAQLPDATAALRAAITVLLVVASTVVAGSAFATHLVVAPSRRRSLLRSQVGARRGPPAHR